MNDDIPALATRDLTISFGGQVAVNAVTCAFRQGTLTAIVGPNGAGKTTYFNLISGQLQPSNGSVSLFGADITRFGAPQRARRGLGRAFQLTNLYPNLSVFENVRLAVQSVAQIRFDLLSIAARNATAARGGGALAGSGQAHAASGYFRRRRCRTATSASSRSRSSWR